MKTPALLLALFLVGCSPASPTLGTLHVPDDPTKVLIVNGHRMTGDVAVALHETHLDYNGECVRGDFVFSPKVAPDEFKMVESAFTHEGPALVVVTNMSRPIILGDRALKAIAEAEAILDARDRTGKLPPASEGAVFDDFERPQLFAKATGS